MAVNSDIFERLKQDHDLHRELLERIEQTHGESDERAELFERLTIELKGHAAAEEQALYSTMMRKPETTDDTRHSVAEHHEIEESLNDIAATDMASGAWLVKFRQLRDEYLHHIDEEEEEHFPDFAEHLTKEDEAFMEKVFERRKAAETAEAEVTPERKEDAKE
ncbi:hemerythrin domain-containing protein [Altererythrobacter sp. CC-YST694]|uniref:hemerythrin domain-containing protein n=1 Tax=Altererythrobacter sp. CC-YST694 TaxID=2755038 RepID=UPI001D02B430|nr:hemerythrin domain-containing protein [Altererythrobacter sp. CC-YST694]MCB5424676.1 hemerythrin domain-containing protein [Altererythrobacter sp. CC-YST694]